MANRILPVCADEAPELIADVAGGAARRVYVDGSRQILAIVNWGNKNTGILSYMCVLLEKNNQQQAGVMCKAQVSSYHYPVKGL